MQITNHAIERYVERVENKHGRTSKRYIQTHRDRIASNIEKLFKYSTFVYKGKNGLEQGRFYVNKQGWVIVLDIEKDTIITLYKLTKEYLEYALDHYKDSLNEFISIMIEKDKDLCEKRNSKYKEIRTINRIKNRNLFEQVFKELAADDIITENYKYTDGYLYLGKQSRVTFNIKGIKNWIFEIWRILPDDSQIDNKTDLVMLAHHIDTLTKINPENCAYKAYIHKVKCEYKCGYMDNFDFWEVEDMLYEIHKYKNVSFYFSYFNDRKIYISTLRAFIFRKSFVFRRFLTNLTNIVHLFIAKSYYNIGKFFKLLDGVYEIDNINSTKVLSNSCYHLIPNNKLGAKFILHICNNLVDDLPLVNVLSDREEFNKIKSQIDSKE